MSLLDNISDKNTSRFLPETGDYDAILCDVSLADGKFGPQMRIQWELMTDPSDVVGQTYGHYVHLLSKDGTWSPAASDARTILVLNNVPGANRFGDKSALKAVSEMSSDGKIQGSYRVRFVQKVSAQGNPYVQQDILSRNRDAADASMNRALSGSGPAPSSTPGDDIPY